MYIGAFLCAALLRIWKAQSAEKTSEFDPSLGPDSLSQEGSGGIVHCDDSGGCFRVRRVRLWKRV